MMKTWIALFLFPLSTLAGSPGNISSLKTMPVQDKAVDQLNFSFFGQNNKLEKTLKANSGSQPMNVPNAKKNAQREGPGRSGGGNFETADSSSIKTLDQQESDAKISITDFRAQWPGFEKFQALLQEQSRTLTPEIREFISSTYTEKKWFIVNRDISFQLCENGTFLEIASTHKKVGICQFADFAFVSQEVLQQLAASDDLTQISILIHEGLVSQMLKTLDLYDQHISADQVDEIQKRTEILVHQMSVDLAKNKYTTLSDLNGDLRKAGISQLFSQGEKDEMRTGNNADRIYLAKDYYLGAKEKLEILKNIFDGASSLSIAQLKNKYGEEICIANRSGFSVPGYWLGAYVRLDETIPEIFETVQIVRDLPPQLNKVLFLKSFIEKTALTPMQFKQGQWVGKLSISMDDLRRMAESMPLDETARKAFEENLNFQMSLGKTRTIFLEPRLTSEGALIIKRSVYAGDKGPEHLLDVDYAMGAIKSYPQCTE